jgi:uncharacterized protein (DUF302 family)
MEVRTVNVQRWSIVSQKPFETVVAAVEGAIGRPNMSEFAKDIAAAATYPEMREVVQHAVSEIGLMEFMRLDVGAVLEKAHPERNPKSIRLIIGNPLIMESMARLVPDAASYAPVTVLIDRRSDGVHLSYDEMASLLAPYGNAEAVEIAGDLDVKVRRLLQEARADHLACRQSDKEDALTIVKTELSGMEDHRKAVQEDIGRRAYALYEADDFKDGLDLDHWFRAERELSVPDVPLSVEKDALTVRITMEQFSGSPLVISVSHRGLLILRVTEDENGNPVEGADRDILRFVSLPSRSTLRRSRAN